MHAVYITLANIHDDIQRKPRFGAWMLLAQLLTSKFANTTFDASGTKAEAQHMPRILKQQLFHEALRIVLEPLAVRHRVLHKIVGPDGYIRNAVPILMGWIADLKEQLVIAGVTQYTCPVSMATHADLGKRVCCKPRTGKSTLNALALVRSKYPLATTWEFACEVKKLGMGLSGCVKHPFWENLGVDPCNFICQDLLHGCHKFFWDHPAKWLAHVIGIKELDNRYIAQPKGGFRHFSHGISKLSQVSGREHRDFQKSILAVIAGVEDIDPRVIRTTRAFLDFIYMAQYPLQSEDTLRDMSTQLNIIHNNISVFIELGARGDMDHLNIPKLYSLPRSINNAWYNGVSLNFMTETAESLHIPMCKDLYNASNRHQYEVQMLHLLDMHERVQFRSTYMAWV